MNHIELSVIIPEERVTDFYVMLGDWLSGKVSTVDRTEPEARPRGRRRAAARPTASSRYSGIGEYLRGREGETIEVSFNELEEAIGGNLPASAQRHRAWWANTERNTQARVWMEQGWRVDSVNFEDQTVTFSRN